MEDRRDILRRALGARRERALDLSDHLAAHPELSGEEHETSRLFANWLEEEGFEVQRAFGGLPTAFQARKGSGGPVVAFLAEMDALPEIGHACGHNLHGTASVLAALAAAETLGDLPGEIRVVGTPAEETDGAKVTQAASGIFDDCDLALMFHASPQETYADYRSLALDGWEFTFTGRPAHAAASPWEGRNALNGLQFFVHALDMLRQHVRPTTRLGGFVLEGGQAPNIVPDRAVYRLEPRCPRRPELDALVERVFDCARGAALATGTQVSWRKFIGSFDDMLPNGPAETLMAEELTAAGFSLSPSPGPLGSTDVGNVSYRCPALQAEVSITDLPLSIHTREFARATTEPQGHDALLRGAQALGLAALRVLTDPQLREALREDFRSRRETRS